MPQTAIAVVKTTRREAWRMAGSRFRFTVRGFALGTLALWHFGTFSVSQPYVYGLALEHNRLHRRLAGDADVDRAPLGPKHARPGNELQRQMPIGVAPGQIEAHPRAL